MAKIKEKYREIREYWESFVGPKSSWDIFKRRVLTGTDKSRAILPKIPRRAMFHTEANSEGRVCMVCGEFKTWENYHKQGVSGGKVRRRSRCKDCQNESEKGRVRDYAEEARGKRAKRRLYKGQKISRGEVKIVDGLPREEVWEVVESVQPGKPPILKSTITGYYKSVKSRDSRDWYRVE